MAAIVLSFNSQGIGYASQELTYENIHMSQDLGVVTILRFFELELGLG